MTQLYVFLQLHTKHNLDLMIKNQFTAQTGPITNFVQTCHFLPQNAQIYEDNFKVAVHDTSLCISTPPHQI